MVTGITAYKKENTLYEKSTTDWDGYPQCQLYFIGDFVRFTKGNIYAAFLGLAPSEDFSGTKTNRMGLPKSGNGHLRQLLIETVGVIARNGRI